MSLSIRAILQIKNMSKLDYNRKMVNKRVFCLVNGGFYGFITDVIDDETFKVKSDKGDDVIVSVFDIREV